MKNTRKTTQEERIEIAKDCIANGYNYGETALKYKSAINRYILG